MGWVTDALKELRAGRPALVRPAGGSMRCRIASGQAVTISPVDPADVRVDDVVLLAWKGNHLLHLVKGATKEQLLIGNNLGKTNGWVARSAVLGRVAEVGGPASPAVTLAEGPMSDGEGGGGSASDRQPSGAASDRQPSGAASDRREGLIRTLGDLMSDVSEDCYHAGWMGGTEHVVPELCRRALATNAVQVWGHGEVTPERADRLWQVAAELGHWVDLDEPGAGYVPFDPFPTPAVVADEIDREQASERSPRRRA